MNRQQKQNSVRTDVIPISELRFRRFAKRVAWIVLALVVLVGVVVSARVMSSHEYALTRMEKNISLNLDKVLHAKDDISIKLDVLNDVAGRHRDKFKKWPKGSVSGDEAAKILKLQNLQDVKINQWRKCLVSSEYDVKSRMEFVLGSVLQETENWPAPGPDPEHLIETIMYYVTGAFGQLFDGGTIGASWPFLVGNRIWEIKHKMATGVICDVGFGGSLRFVLFPYTAAKITPGFVFGFGVIVVLVGYLFCFIGMKINATFFSAIGLFYFLYAITGALFIVFILLGLL